MKQKSTLKLKKDGNRVMVTFFSESMTEAYTAGS